MTTTTWIGWEHVEESTASSNYALLRGKHLSMSDSVTLLRQPTDMHTPIEGEKDRYVFADPCGLRAVL